MAAKRLIMCLFLVPARSLPLSLQPSQAGWDDLPKVKGDNSGVGVLRIEPL